MNPLQFPKLEKYVNDFSGVFDPQKIEELSILFKTHEDTTSEQIVTILFPHRQGNELLDIGLKVFNENGIGQKDTNNGLLLIIATEEKKLRIVVGKGLEYKYTNSLCSIIIETRLRPLLNEEKYEELIEEWYYIISNFEKETSLFGGNNKIKSEINSDKNIPPRLTTIVPPLIFIIIILIFGSTIFLEISIFLFGIAFLVFGFFFLIFGGLRRRDGKESTIFFFVGFVFFVIGLITAWKSVDEFQCISNNSPKCVELRSSVSNIRKTSTSNGNHWYSSSSSSSHFSGGGGGSHGGGGGD